MDSGDVLCQKCGCNKVTQYKTKVVCDLCKHEMKIIICNKILTREEVTRAFSKSLKRYFRELRVV